MKVVASLNIFGQGNYCTKNLCTMCTGTKADFSLCKKISSPQTKNPNDITSKNR